MYLAGTEGEVGGEEAHGRAGRKDVDGEGAVVEGVPDHAGVVAVGGAVEGGLGTAEGGEEQGAVAEALGRGELDLGPQARGEVWRVGHGVERGWG